MQSSEIMEWQHLVKFVIQLLRIPMQGSYHKPSHV